MRTQSFTENGVTITVRAETIEDALDTDMLTHQMGFATARENYKRAQFAQCVLLSTIEGNIGFEWPTADSSVDDLMVAYDHWRKLPGEFIRQWKLSITLANATSNDPDLTPATSEKKEQTPT